MWGARDEFQFAWRKMTGDFLIRTHVQFVGAGVDPHRKIGVDRPQGPRGRLALRRRDGARRRPDVAAAPAGRRRADGDDQRAPITHADVIELKREGRRYIMGVAKFGEPMVHTEFYGPDLGRRRLRRPVRLLAQPEGEGDGDLQQRPDRRAAEGRLGAVPRLHRQQPRDAWTSPPAQRTVLHTSPISIQAPNWTTDGKTLIFNGSGKLWTLRPRDAGPSTEMNTGLATRNNNDHVLSFDGTMLGISQRTARIRPTTAAR